MTAREMIDELAKVPPHAPVRVRLEMTAGGEPYLTAGGKIAGGAGRVNAITRDVERVRWQGSHVELYGGL